MNIDYHLILANFDRMRSMPCVIIFLVYSRNRNQYEKMCVIIKPRKKTVISVFTP